MTTRLRTIIAATLIAGTGVLARAAHESAIKPEAHLDDVPMVVGGWNGHDAGALDEESERILAADGYLNRTYQSSAAPAAPVGLYIAYYAQQRPGVSIHSPLHCLPGTGWEPLGVDTLPIDVPGGDEPTTSVRRMIVRKNLDRAVVLYWYAVHGRVLAGEVASRLWLLHDSLQMHRSDAALVRIVVPAGRDSGNDEGAQRQAAAFARALLPLLSHVWS